MGRSVRAVWLSAQLFLPAVASAATLAPIPINIIDGIDDRGSLLRLGPALGLSAAEIARIRLVSGHVLCAGDEPMAGSGALFLTNDQILTAGHLLFENGHLRTKCYFRSQTDGSAWIALDLDRARFGGSPPKPGSNDDWAIVRLSEPIAGAEPFPVATTAPAAGDRLIVVSAHPLGMEAVDPAIPVVQACTIRRVPISSAATSFYRTDCDATGGSSGGMHLARVGGALAFRGMSISSGPADDPKLAGAPYNEKAGSVTTALGVDRAILAAGKSLAAP